MSFYKIILYYLVLQYGNDLVLCLYVKNNISWHDFSFIELFIYTQLYTQTCQFNLLFVVYEKVCIWAL